MEFDMILSEEDVRPFIGDYESVRKHCSKCNRHGRSFYTYHDKEVLCVDGDQCKQVLYTCRGCGRQKKVLEDIPEIYIKKFRKDVPLVPRRYITMRMKGLLKEIPKLS